MCPGTDARPIVLLTGFGPFPGIPVNASAELIGRVARRARRALPQFQFATVVLPTEWDRAPRRITALHRRLRPVLALHFGVASGADGIRLEAEATNACRPLLDAADALPAGPLLCASGPNVRHATIPLLAITDALKAGGWPCTVSHDAGGYLCNAVLYQSLACAEARGNCEVGFVHIPSDLSKQPARMAEVAAGALEIIGTALASRATDRPLPST